MVPIAGDTSIDISTVIADPEPVCGDYGLGADHLYFYCDLWQDD